MSLTLQKGLVQALLLYELLLLSAVALHKVALPVIGQELHELVLSLDMRFRFMARLYIAQLLP